MARGARADPGERPCVDIDGACCWIAEAMSGAATRRYRADGPTRNHRILPADTRYVSAESATRFARG